MSTAYGQSMDFVTDVYVMQVFLCLSLPVLCLSLPFQRTLQQPCIGHVLAFYTGERYYYYVLR